MIFSTTETKIGPHVAAAALALIVAAGSATSVSAQGLFGDLNAGLEVGIDRFQAAGQSENALYFGANIGYRRQKMGGLVYGGQFRLGQSTGKIRTTRIVGADTVTTVHDAGMQYGFDGIVGQALGRRHGVLVFGTLGYTWNNVKRRETNLTSGLTTATSHTGSGFRFGGGAELRINRSTNFRGSVNFSDTTSDAQFLAGAFFRF